MKRKSKHIIRKFIFTVIGIALIAWAVTPTPDDVTVIAPIVILIAGVGFIYNGWKDDINKVEVPKLTH